MKGPFVAFGSLDVVCCPKAKAARFDSRRPPIQYMYFPPVPTIFSVRIRLGVSSKHQAALEEIADVGERSAKAKLVGMVAY
jgi:hypothetical protein